MTNISNIVVEVATKNIRKLLKEGASYEDAMNKIKEEYGITEDEESKIDDIISDEQINDIKQDNDIIKDGEFILYFQNEDELDDSIGRLMFNRIPWEFQGIINDKNAIKFKDEDTLKKAIKLLNKFKVVRDEFTPLAKIEFDDYDAFKEAINFLKRDSGIYLVDGESDKDISEILPVVDSFKTMNKKQGDIVTNSVLVQKIF